MRRSFAVVLLGALCALVGIGTAPTSGEGAPEPQGTEAPPSCAFPAVVDGEVANIAFPDTNATYWVMPLDLAADDTVSVTGQFPYARYMSFNTYDGSGASYGALHDALVVADPGSVNPFLPDQSLDAADRSYTVSVAPVAEPSLQSSAPSTVETGVGFSWLVYRVYVPFDPSSEAGQVPLPAVTIDRADGTQESYEPCTSFGPEPGLDALVAVIVRDSLANALPPAENPEFVTPGSSAGLFPNVDNKYVYATTTWQPGRLVVVRGLAATFPDTPEQSIYPSRQLRYWSFCTNLLVDPAPVVSCAADADTALAPDGAYTYVVSADQDRPSPEALARAHATWLPWFGSIAEQLPPRLRPVGNLILRNMLPDPSFTQAVQDIVEPNSNGAAVAAMGPHYPSARYCERAVFEQGGADACFAEPPVEPVQPVVPSFTG